MDPQRIAEEPLGCPPFLEVLLLPLTSQCHAKVPSGGFLAQIGRQLKLGELRCLLSERLALPLQSLSSLMSDGQDLSDELSMKENNLVLPGPAARRAGQKVELYFDIVRDVHEALEGAKRAEATRLEEKAREREQKAQEVVRLAHAEERRKALRQRELETADEVFQQLIQDRIGMPRSVAEAKRADPEFRMPKHFLEAVTPEQTAALQKLMRQTGVQANVLAAFQNVNETLWHRYETAGRRLQSGASSIQQRSTQTSKCFTNGSEFAVALGDFDPAINEFPLWHGTGAPEKAGSICEHGFDPQYFGQQGSAYGAGFYFAEQAAVSHNYSRSWHVNATFPRCQVILLCRVLAGTMKESGGVPSEEQRERLTAECLGPGGCFGASSSFHSVLGANWAYVAMHPHQTFPEFTIIYQA